MGFESGFVDEDAGVGGEAGECEGGVGPIGQFSK